MRHAQVTLLGGDPADYRMLSEQPLLLWKALQSGASTDVLGCLEKLSSCLLQCHRLQVFHDSLVAKAKMGSMTGPPSVDVPYFTVNSAMACTDFEALVLLACSAIERLSHCVAQRIANQTTWQVKVAETGQNQSVDRFAPVQSATIGVPLTHLPLQL